MIICPKCDIFHIDTSEMVPGAVEQMKEALAYHMKHSKFCGPANDGRIYGQ